MTFNYSENKGDYQALWSNFKNFLLESINEIDKSDFEIAWKTRGERTNLYFNTLLPNVADKMKLGFDKEMIFRRDGIFYKIAGQGKTKVPLIFIESENDPYSCDDEVYKLCLLNAPLKVLMICTDWNEKKKNEIIDGYIQYIIENFKDESSLTGYFALIIAEWVSNDMPNDILKFHTYVYNDKAENIEDKLLIDLIIK